jgi:hypothetical protein
MILVLLFNQAVAPTPGTPSLDASRAPRAVERRPDVVLRWNEEALEAIRLAKTPPPLAARALAILHVGLFDTLNTLYGSHQPYLVRLRATAEIDPIAGCCGCAETVLSELFPKRAKHFRTVRDQMLEAVPNGMGRKRGIDLGVHVARRLLLDRKDDSGEGTYRVPAAVGIWRPTPPAKASPLLPGWGEVKPFGVRDKRKFRAPDPPDLTSDEYARDFNEVKSLGGVDSQSRTADQALIALFWNDAAGTCTPPGHWNMIATEVSLDQKLTLVENARLFALLNLAMADASICCWHCKFRYRYWRPITAIHEAARDANDATVPDTRWKPLLDTPPFPSYTSGHSTFSGAGASILHGYFKKDIAFSIESDGLIGRRSFKTFRQAAEEAGRSRIYGGIHFECDNREGLAVGTAIAREILRTRLTPSSPPAEPTVSAPRGRP